MLSHISGEFAAHEADRSFADTSDMGRIADILLKRSHGWTAEEKGHDIHELNDARAAAALHEHAKPDFYLATMEELELRAAGYPLISLIPVPMKKRVIKSLGPENL